MQICSEPRLGHTGALPPRLDWFPRDSRRHSSCARLGHDRQMQQVAMQGKEWTIRGAGRDGETNSASIYVYLQRQFTSSLSVQEASWSAGLMQFMNDLSAEEKISN